MCLSSGPAFEAWSLMLELETLDRATGTHGGRLSGTNCRNKLRTLISSSILPKLTEARAS